MVVYDLEHRKVVTETYLIVVSVVGRGNLETSRTEIHLDIIILDNRDLPVDQRNEHLLATQPMMTFVFRVHADGSIRHNRLGTGGGNDEILVGRIAVTV